jgi:hypothetical protein
MTTPEVTDLLHILSLIGDRSLHLLLDGLKERGAGHVRLEQLPHEYDEPFRASYVFAGQDKRDYIRVGFCQKLMSNELVVQVRVLCIGHVVGWDCQVVLDDFRQPFPQFVEKFLVKPAASVAAHMAEMALAMVPEPASAAVN